MSELYFPSLSSDSMPDDGPASSAELQGALCGLLCADTQANRNSWYTRLFEGIQADEDDIIALTELFDNTVQSLNSLDFDFRLDLPDDVAPLSSRITALADWCQGLTFGLSVAGLKQQTELSAESQEYIADVIKISQLNDSDVEESDDEETNFAELVEYLRMGLFLLHGELQPFTAPDDSVSH